MKTVKESQALLDVWEWKEKAFKEVEKYDITTALDLRLHHSMETAKKLGSEFVFVKLNKK